MSEWRYPRNGKEREGPVALILPRAQPGTIRIKRYLDAVEAEAVCLRCECSVTYKAKLDAKQQKASDEFIKRAVMARMEEQHQNCDATPVFHEDGAIGQKYNEWQKLGGEAADAERQKDLMSKIIVTKSLPDGHTPSQDAPRSNLTPSNV